MYPLRRSAATGCPLLSAAATSFSLTCPMSSRRAFIRQTTTLLAAAPLAGSSRPAAGRPVLRFAVASDGHFGQAGTPYEEDHARMVAWLNQEADGPGLDLVFFNGDLIHDDPALLPRVKHYYDQLHAPYFVGKGNHDQVSNEVWRQTWGYGENHDFVRGRVGFIIAATATASGAYRCADLTWLQAALARHRRRRHLFVFLHIAQQPWVEASLDCPAVMALLEQTPNLTATFHGHDHSADGVFTSAGKPFCFDAHLGGNWGTDYRGYRVVEVDARGRVHTYQYNPAARPVRNAHTWR